MARTPAARFRGRLAFLALSALTGSASAGITLSSFPPNPGVLPVGGWQFTSGTTFADPTPPRAWVNGVYGGVPSATASDSLALSGRAGSLAVTAKTTVSAVQVAASLARVAARANAAIAIGSLAYDLLAGAGVRNTGGGAEIDPGTEQIITSGLCWESDNVCYDTADAAWRSWHTGEYDSFRDYGVSTCTPAGPSAANCTTTLIRKSTGEILGSTGMMINATISNNVKSCPALIDALTGQSYVPGVRDDGKCMTGRYAAALSEAKIASALAPVVEKSVSEAAKAAISEGAQIESSGFQVTGPASQIGQSASTTTTTPSGTTTTTTTPTYNYSYNGDKITYTTTTVTNTCTGAGSCSTDNADTTTTTTTGSPTPQDPADPCTADPSRLGCLKLGEPPDDKVPKNNKTVTFTPEVLGLGGSCPAPVQLPHGQQISYQTVCDGVVQARPLIIAMGFLMAGGIMLGALRPQ